MATYTPEQIREFTKGMSDKQIAEAAQKFNVSADQLAGAFNTTPDVINTRAQAAGVPLAPSMSVDQGSSIVAPGGSSSGDTTSLNLAPTSGAPSMPIVGQYASSVIGGSSSGDTTGLNLAPTSGAPSISVDQGSSPVTPGGMPGVTTGFTPMPTYREPTPAVLDPSKYGIKPTADFTSYIDQISATQDEAKKISTDLMEAGGINPYISKLYGSGDIETLNKVLAAGQVTADDLVSAFNATPGDLNYLASQGVVAPGIPAPPAPAPAPATPAPVEIPEVADVTIADSTGAPVTYQYGSQINDQLAEAWTAGSQSGDYTQVNALLNKAGYTLDDVQKQFNLDENGMAALKAAGITGVSPDNSAIAGLWEQITELQAQNQDYSSQVTALNGLLSGIGLTMDDLKSRFALSDDDVQFVESLGVLQTPSPTMTDVIEERMLRPELPQDGRFDPALVQRDPSQIIGTDSGIGQVGSAQQATGATMGTAMTAGAVTPTDAQTMQSRMASPQVNAALDKINPALGSVSEKAQIEAVTMSPTSTDVGTISPAQLAEAQRVQQPQSRTLQSGEMVQSAVDAQKATAFVEEVQSASADPSAKATVQGQLADLMSQFEDGAIPSWASGAMRTANATLAARGLGASSLAGQAVVQAAMESAIPIAVQDAQTQSQFEQQNLSNRQQRAMLAAQQRAQFIGQEFDQEFQARVANAAKISDIANMNFTAEQQIALENARLAQSVDLANLSNQQAMVMAETAQISQLELSNLNNRQQAAVQNAQSFLQMDLTNLSNTQQTTMFDAQSRVNALLSDAAAENASRQFNATSENQTNQFFQSLQTQVQQFNANQLNTMEQIRLEQTNIMSKFNAQLMAQQEQFNATNQLAIAQSDAQWNRQLATLDTAAINSANQFNAQAILEMSNQAFANAAQILRDQMDYAFQAGQKDADRELQIVIQKMSQDASKYAADAQEDAAWSTAVGTLAAAVLL